MTVEKIRTPSSVVVNAIQTVEDETQTVVDVDNHMEQRGNQVAVVIQVQRLGNQFGTVIQVELLYVEQVKRVSEVDGLTLISGKPVKKQALVRTPSEKGELNLVL